MPLKVIKKQFTTPQVGDGGPVGAEQYLICRISSVIATQYILPGKVLINKIICRSKKNRTCSIIGVQTDLTVVELMMETTFPINEVVPYPTCQYIENKLSIHASDEAAMLDDIPLWVIICYQPFAIPNTN